MDVDWLIRARWVVPGLPLGRVLEDHIVVVNDGAVSAVLPATEGGRWRARHRLELPAHVVLPGLVNAHTHAAMSLFRGIADDRPLQEWLEEHIWPLERRFVDAAFVRAGTRLAVAEMLRSGTTCCNDMYFFPREAAEVIAAAGMRAVIGAPVLEFETPWAADAAGCLALARELIAALADQPRLRPALCPHAPYSVSDESFRAVAALAAKHGLRVHTHLHETAAEIEGSIAQHGVRPLARLARLGLVNERLIAVHATQLEPAEIQQLAQAGAAVVHCPESNLKLASGHCPATALLAAKVTLALGTDGAASNNNLDLLAETRTAALLGKLAPLDCTAFSATEALHAATLGGARALGLAASVGSLTPGKRADLIAVDLGGYPETQPVYEPISQLVYAASGRQVSHTWVDGQLLLDDGRLTTLDLDAVLAEAADWGLRIAAPPPTQAATGTPA